MRAVTRKKSRTGARQRRSRAGAESAAGSQTAYERAYSALREAVLAGHFEPGEVLTLRTLVAKLGVGTMPAREALKRLTSEGAFEALPNRSARVPVLSRRQVTQILDLRRQLEGNAAYLAAQNITLLQIERLRQIQQEVAACAPAGDIKAYAARNMEFHFEIYRIADNPVLLTLIQALWLRMAPLLTSTLQLFSRDRKLLGRIGVGHHEKLLEAFQHRDPDAAEKAMREDLITPTQFPGYWEAIDAKACQQPVD
jgi:DNA-binding GntR family transcriptional regulator